MIIGNNCDVSSRGLQLLVTSTSSSSHIKVDQIINITKTKYR